MLLEHARNEKLSLFLFVGLNAEFVCVYWSTKMSADLQVPFSGDREVQSWPWLSVTKISPTPMTLTRFAVTLNLSSKVRYYLQIDNRCFVFCSNCFIQITQVKICSETCIRHLEYWVHLYVLKQLVSLITGCRLRSFFQETKVKKEKNGGSNREGKSH